MPGYGFKDYKNQEINCEVKIMAELDNFFDCILTDMLTSVFKYKGITKSNLFVFYEDITKVEPDGGQGIYLFFDKDYMKIEYIGSTSKSLRERVLRHISQGRGKYKGDSIIFIGCRNIPATVMKQIEHALILLIRPERNNLHKFDNIR